MKILSLCTQHFVVGGPGEHFEHAPVLCPVCCQSVYSLQIQLQSVRFAVLESKWSIFRSSCDHRSVLHMQRAIDVNIVPQVFFEGCI